MKYYWTLGVCGILAWSGSHIKAGEAVKNSSFIARGGWLDLEWDMEKCLIVFQCQLLLRMPHPVAFSVTDLPDKWSEKTSDSWPEVTTRVGLSNGPLDQSDIYLTVRPRKWSSIEQVSKFYTHICKIHQRWSKLHIPGNSKPMWIGHKRELLLLLSHFSHVWLCATT